MGLNTYKEALDYARACVDEDLDEGYVNNTGNILGYLKEVSENIVENIYGEVFIVAQGALESEYRAGGKNWSENIEELSRQLIFSKLFEDLIKRYIPESERKKLNIPY